MNIYKRPRTYVGGCDPLKNGEILFWNYLQNKIKPQIIFDVGVEKSSHLVDNSILDYSKFYLFEPNYMHYQSMLERYTNNKNVFMYNFGFGKFDNENTKLYPAAGSIIYRDKTVPKHKLCNNTIDIMCTKLDNFIKDNNISKIDFLKIDVEGYEYNVLCGAKNSFNLIDIIQFEFGDTYIDAGINLCDIIDFFPNRKFYAIENNGLNIQSYFDVCQEKSRYTNFLISKYSFEDLNL